MEESSSGGVELDLPRNTPEIISNPMLEGTQLIYSTPVFNEWSNGNLISSVRAMLSQRLNPGVAIETNYVINFGDGGHEYVSYGKDRGVVNWDKLKEDPKYQDAYDQARHSIDFIKKVVEVQALARLIQSNGGFLNRKKRSEYQSQMQEIINEEVDPLIKDVLNLALQKADQVAISGISTLTEDVSKSEYRGISGFRNLGMDYVYKKTADPNVIMSMYDCDTVPENNKYSQTVIDIYRQHPDINFVFTNLSYLPAGEEQRVLAHSPGFSLGKSLGYNDWLTKGSPQITFRHKCIEDLQRLTGMMWQGDEDRDTALRLIMFYGDMQTGILAKATSVTIPASLTSDRIGGFVDAHGKSMSIEQEGIQTVFEKLGGFHEFRNKVIKKITRLEGDLKSKAQSDMENSYKRNTHKQKVLLRFNRLIASGFIDALEAGEIKITNEGLMINDQVIIKRSGGKALLSYIRGNNDLIRSSTKKDLDYIKYLLGKGEFPTDIDSLSPTQLAIREYIGEFGNTQEIIQKRIQTENRDKKDKHSYFQPLLAEVLALSEIYIKYLFDQDMAEYKNKYKDDPYHSPILKDTPLQERSAWLDQKLPKKNEPQVNSQILVKLLQKMPIPLSPILQRIGILKIK